MTEERMNLATTPPGDAAQAQLESARKELAKLPTLGPALWLYARDPQRRYGFYADIDWRFMPPLVLDQCRLFTKADLPWAFVSWAFVSDAVAERLRSAVPVIAPHEWKSGPHPWLIDVVAPFGDVAAVTQEVARDIAPGQVVRAWLPDAQGQLSLKELSPHG
ncbi:MAG TPA: toxin-activating lysine-acyltransferase [Roseateles sp.]